MAADCRRYFSTFLSFSKMHLCRSFYFTPLFLMLLPTRKMSRQIRPHFNIVSLLNEKASAALIRFSGKLFGALMMTMRLASCRTLSACALTMSPARRRRGHCDAAAATGDAEMTCSLSRAWLAHAIGVSRRAPPPRSAFYAVKMPISIHDAPPTGPISPICARARYAPAAGFFLLAGVHIEDDDYATPRSIERRPPKALTKMPPR